MKAKYLIAATVLTFAVANAGVAQTTSSTKVTTSTGTTDSGAPVKTTKVVHVRKHKTRHVKKILGVKVGHKTRVSKTVHETTTGPDGTTTKTETTHQ